MIASKQAAKPDIQLYPINVFNSFHYFLIPLCEWRSFKTWYEYDHPGYDKMSAYACSLGKAKAWDFFFFFKKIISLQIKFALKKYLLFFLLIEWGLVWIRVSLTCLRMYCHSFQQDSNLDCLDSTVFEHCWYLRPLGYHRVRMDKLFDFEQIGIHTNVVYWGLSVHVFWVIIRRCQINVYHKSSDLLTWHIDRNTNVRQE